MSANLLSPGDRVFLGRISQSEVLPEDLIQRLIPRARQGDTDAESKIIGSYARLILWVAYSYRHQKTSPSVMDFFQEGVIGLQKAIKKYSRQNNVKLSTYAVYWIRAMILAAIVEEDPLPATIFWAKNSVAKTLRAAGTDEERTETAKYWAGRLEHALGEDFNIRSLLTARIVSFETHQPYADLPTPLERIGDEGRQAEATQAAMDHELLCSNIERMLHLLNQREELVLRHTFGIGRDQLSPQEIAVLLDITVQKVTESRDKGLRYLRNNAPFQTALAQ